MSKGFTPTRRSAACSICGDFKGDCRTGQITLSSIPVTLHLCMKQPDGGDTPSHKYFGLTKDGLWGKYVVWQELPQKPSPWTEEEKQRYLQEKERHKQEREKIERHKLANCLSVEQRDRIIRRLHKHWGLSTADRQRIRDRGLSDRQIDEGCYFSLSAFPELPPGIPFNFPGVSGDKLWLKPGDEGIACPISDHLGRSIGFQIRRNANDDRERYKWAGWDGASKLPNGEYPLAYYRPDNGVILRPAIGLAEGTNFKPKIAANLLGQIFVGASGGQFYNSPEQLRNYIKDNKEVEVYPDAGDVSNRHVILRWRRIKDLLVEWGISIKFAWWGQVNKDNDSDIDEGVNPEEIKYLSWEQFEAIAIQHCPNYKPEPTSVNETPQQKTEPQSRYSHQKQQKIDKAWLDWRNKRKLSPTLTINQRYLSVPLPEPRSLNFFKSGLGTGKTHQVIEYVKTLKDEGWLAISYRNSILLQFCAKCPEFYHLQTEMKGQPEQILLRDTQSNIALCIDSLIYFDPEDFDGKNVIIDELESVILSLFQANTSINYYRQKVKDLLGELLNRANRIFCLDGHLSDLTINYIKSLLKEPRKLLIVENHYQGNRGKVEFYEGSEDGNGKLRLSDTSCVISAILNNPNCLAVGSDSQNAIETLDKLLKDKDAKGFRLDSTTINQSWAKEFFKDPKAFILKYKPKYFLYSPSAEAGLDINIQNYFSDIYYLFFGVILTNQQLQIMGRIRDAEASLHVFCAFRGMEANHISKSSNTQKVIEEIIEYVVDDANATLSELDTEQKILGIAKQLITLSQDPHFKHECELISQANHEKNYLRDCLKEALVVSGYNVKCVKGFKVSVPNYKDGKNTVIDRVSFDIYKSQDISTSEANKKSSNFASSWQDKCEIARRRLLERLPGIEKAVVKTIIREPAKSSNYLESNQSNQQQPNLFPPSILADSAQISQSFKLKPLQLSPSKNLSLLTSFIQPMLQKLSSIKTFLYQPLQLLLLSYSASEKTSSIQLFPFKKPRNTLFLYQLQTITNFSYTSAPATSLQLAALQEPLHSLTNYQNQREMKPIVLDSQSLSGFISQNNETKEIPNLTLANSGNTIIEREVYSNILRPEFIRLVKYEKRGLIAQTEILWLLEHPEIAQQLQQSKWFKLLKIFTDPNEPDSSKKMNLTTHRSRWLKIKTLLSLGILQFFAPGKTWNKDSPEVIELWEAGKKPSLARAIGIRVGKSKPTEYLGRILASLGLKTCSNQINRVWVYQLDSAWLEDPDRLAIYNCIGVRYEELLSGEKTVLNWNEILKTQVQTEQGLQGCTPSPYFINQTSGRCVGKVGEEAVAKLPENQVHSDIDPHTSAEDLIKTNESCTNSLTSQSQQSEESPIEWLMQLLADLEAIPTPHPRFESSEQLVALFYQAEELGIQCQDRLLSHCPEYWERLAKGIGEICQLLPEKAIPDDSPEQFEACAFRVMAALDYGVDRLKGILKLWSIEQRTKVVLAMQELASEAVDRLAELLPDWLAPLLG
ncbi:MULTISPECIES: plasmid replication protein, CyRepA1 family [Aerosakkonema]|uniref:plasmid replication protein, CyRepA1 family n=1 Tax=Aerosakkonema TaxID=1246629 RepID=UPI0035B8BFE7